METCGSCCACHVAASVCRGLPHSHVLLCSHPQQSCQECDAATSLLRRLHVHMVRHDVDFIGGDFDMNAFSTVGVVFTDAEFSAPFWGTGGLDDSHKDCAGFLIMPRRPFTWRVHQHVCFKFGKEALGFAPSDLTAHCSVFRHLRVTNLPGPSSVTRSAQAQHHLMEGAAGKNDRKRLCKRLAKQSASNALSTQPQSSCASFETQSLPQQPASTARAGNFLSPFTSTSTPFLACSAPPIAAHPPTHTTGSLDNTVLARTSLPTPPARTQSSRSPASEPPALFTQPDELSLLGGSHLCTFARASVQLPLLVGRVNSLWTIHRPFALGCKCHLSLIFSTTCPVLVMSDIDSSRPCWPRPHQAKLFGTADNLDERLLQLATHGPVAPTIDISVGFRAASTTLRTDENRRLSEALIFCLLRH